MIIIGITGTLGAGKGTVVDYLVQKYHFVHFSVRDFLKEEVAKRNLPQNRDSFTQVANDLRRLYSPSYIVDQLYERAAQQSQNAIIESIRTPGEIDSLKQKADFILLAKLLEYLQGFRPKIKYKSLRHLRLTEILLQ